MRHATIIIAVFLFMGMLAAEPALLAIFISHSFENGTAVSSRALLADGSYYLVGAGGVETYVVDAASGKAVSGLAQLQSILEQDAR